MSKDRKILIIVLRVFLLIALVSIFYIVRQSDSLARYMPLDFRRCAHVAWSSVWALILLAAAFSAGSYLLRLFNFPDLSALESIIFSFALGLAFLIASGFAMAALGLYRLEILLLLLVAIFASCSSTALRQLRTPRTQGEQIEKIDPNWFRAFAIAVIIILLIPNFLGALAPPNNWDELVYQLVIPKTYIKHSGFDRIDYLLFFDMPHNVNLLYGFSLMGRSAESSHLISFAFGILTATALICFSRKFYSEISGWFAVLIFVTTPVVMLETNAALVDVTMAFFFCVSVYAVLLWGENARIGFLVLGAIIMGIIVGCKYQGVYCFGALLVALLTIPPKDSAHFSSKHIISMIVFIMVTTLLTIPWLVKNLAFTGNPVYPNLYGLFGGKDWSPQISDQLHFWLQSIGMGRSAKDFLLLPWRLTVRATHYYSRFSGIITPFYFFTLPLIFFVSQKTRITFRLLLICFIYIVLWFLGSQQIRFLIPMLAILAIVNGHILAQLFKKGKIINTAVFLAIVFLIVGFVSISADLSDVYLSGSYVSQAFGTGDRDEFLTNVRSIKVHPVIEFINKSLPENSVILMIFENRGYYLERKYVADGAYEASRILPWFNVNMSPQETLNILIGRGITHILVNETYAKDYPGTVIGRFYPKYLKGFEKFSENYLREIKRADSVVLYEIIK